MTNVVSPPPALHTLPGIERLNITDRRRSRELVHARLRRLILDGVLPPRSTLSQVQLSQAFGVSRTPLREALRMLQEEGLVDAEPNKRPRVRGFEPADLESVYSTRILLESFALELTIPAITSDDVRAAEAALDGLRAATQHQDFEGWRRSHRSFHRVLAQGGGEQMVELIEDQAQKAERYLTFYQHRDTRSWWARDTVTEHRQLLDLVLEDHRSGGRGSVAMLGRHLARTALLVLAEVEPERDPLPVRIAFERVLTSSKAPEPAAVPRGTRADLTSEVLAATRHLGDNERA